MDFSNCYVAKVKSFLGLRSIDPPIPFEIFLDKNRRNLKSLIEKNLIIVLDDLGNELDSSLWEDHIITFSENANGLIANEESTKTKLEQKTVKENTAKPSEKIEQEIQEVIDRLTKIDEEENGKIAHKKRLIKSLQDCDGPSRLVIEEGIEHAEEKIVELQEERKSLLIRMNQQIKD